MRSFKSWANSDRYSANTHTLYRHVHFPAALMTLWRGRIFWVLLVSEATNKQALILIPKWCFPQETKAIPVSGFFLTTSLPATLNRAWKFNIRVHKQSRQHPMFPQQGSHFSCRDLFSFAPSFKHLLLSKSCSGGATKHTNISPIASEFTHLLLTSQRTFQAFYCFYLRAWRTT